MKIHSLTAAIGRERSSKEALMNSNDVFISLSFQRLSFREATFRGLPKQHHGVLCDWCLPHCDCSPRRGYLGRYVRYRDSLLIDKICYAENGAFFLSLPAGSPVWWDWQGTHWRSWRPSPPIHPSRSAWWELHFCKPKIQLTQQRVLWWTSLNTGRTRASSTSEAGMIARLLRANSSAAVELGVVITYTYLSRS